MKTPSKKKIMGLLFTAFILFQLSTCKVIYSELDGNKYQVKLETYKRLMEFSITLGDGY